MRNLNSLVADQSRLQGKASEDLEMIKKVVGQASKRIPCMSVHSRQSSVRSLLSRVSGVSRMKSSRFVGEQSMLGSAFSFDSEMIDQMHYKDITELVHMIMNLKVALK